MSERHYGFWGRTVDSVEDLLDAGKDRAQSLERERDALRARMDRVSAIVAPFVCHYGPCLSEGPQCMACRVAEALNP